MSFHAFNEDKKEILDKKAPATHRKKLFLGAILRT